MRSHMYLSIFLAGILLIFPAVPVEAVNINNATAEELQTVKGIGPKTAQRIIDERVRAGQFSGPEDLINRVKGLGEKSLNKIQGSIEFTDGGTVHRVTDVAHPGEEVKSAAATFAPIMDCRNSDTGTDKESTPEPNKTRITAKTKKLTAGTEVARAIKDNKALVRPKYIEGPYFIKPQHAGR